MFLSSEFCQNHIIYLISACIFPGQKVTSQSHMRLWNFKVDFCVPSDTLVRKLTVLVVTKTYSIYDLMVCFVEESKVLTQFVLLYDLVHKILNRCNKVACFAVADWNIALGRSSHQEVVYSVYLLYYYYSYDWLHYTIYHNPHNILYMFDTLCYCWNESAPYHEISSMQYCRHGV